MVLHKQLLALLCGLALTAWGCDNGAKKQSGGGDKKGGDDEEKDGDGDDGGKSDGSALSGEGDFDGWCKKSGETAFVKDKLKKHYDTFCAGGKAQAMLKSQLIGGDYLYAGSGDPKLKSIEAIKSDKESKETSYYFGVAIKLPISIQTHFDKVGPKAGDEATQKKLAEVNGAEAEVQIVDKFNNDGKYHVRGWRIHSKATKDVGIKLTTESEGRSDQYELEKGKLYQYTQITEKGIQVVKTFNMLTAGMKVGEDSYLITLVDLVVDNKGFDSVAEKQIKDTAKQTIKAMYKGAAEIGGAGLVDDEDGGAGGEEPPEDGSDGG